MYSLRRIIKFPNHGLKYKRFVSNGSESMLDLRVDKEGIAVLSMQRTPLNCLNLELMTGIGDALKEVEKNKWKGLILTSAIPSIFSAGMDIKEMYKPDVNRLTELWKATRRVTSELLNSGYVTASAITGHTSAAGCILAILTEHRVMVDSNGTISLNDTALDIAPPSWVVEAMIHVMGRREAELALTASTLFSPREAKKAGLIDDIASNKDDAIAKCKAFINVFDKIPPMARLKTKQLIRKDILDVWSEENELHRVENYVKEVTSPQRQKALELYLEAMKKKKKE